MSVSFIRSTSLTQNLERIFPKCSNILLLLFGFCFYFLKRRKSEYLYPQLQTPSACVPRSRYAPSLVPAESFSFITRASHWLGKSDPLCFNSSPPVKSKCVCPCWKLLQLYNRFKRLKEEIYLCSCYKHQGVFVSNWKYLLSTCPFLLVPPINFFPHPAAPCSPSSSVGSDMF